MNIRKKLFIIYCLSLLGFGITYSQSNKLVQLKTPQQSLELLSNALIKNDSITIKKIATKEGFEDIKSRNLYMYGNNWISSLKENKVSVISNSNNVVILAIGQEDYLLAFAMEKKTKEWKFSGFITEE